MRMLVATFLISLLPSVCQATVVASVGPAFDGGRTLSSPGTGVYSFGWSQTSDYTNVSIQIWMYDWVAATGGAAGTINVYLTDQVGPTTTALANELFSATVAYPAFQAGALTIFSGLTLGPGDYYVTVTGGTGSASIGESTVSPTVVLDSGVSLLGNYLAIGSPASYIPSLATPWAFSTWSFEVNGTAVPEPSTLWLLPSAAAIMAIRRKRR